MTSLFIESLGDLISDPSLLTNPATLQLITPLLAEWSFCQPLLEMFVVQMSPAMFDTIIERHRAVASNGIWCNTLRDALSPPSSETNEIMRRLWCMLPTYITPVVTPVATKKRKQAEDSVSSAPKRKNRHLINDMITDDASPKYQAVRTAMLTPADVTIEAAQWEACVMGSDPLAFELSLNEWKALLKIMPSAALVVKRRFVCFWLHNLTTTKHDYHYLNKTKLLPMVKQIMQNDAEWAGPLIKAHADNIRIRILRSDLVLWGEILALAA